MRINSPLRLIISIIIGICLVLYFYRGINRLSHKKAFSISLISLLDAVFIICLFVSILDIAILKLYNSEYILVDASFSMTLNDYAPNRYERVKEGIQDKIANNDTTVIPFGAFPLPFSVQEFIKSDIKQFQQLTGRSGSAPGDALARTIQQKPTSITLITDGGVNSGLDLNGVDKVYTGKIIVGLLKSNDMFLSQTGQKTQLVTMNLPYRQSVITGKNELHIISTHTQIQDLLQLGGLKEKSISKQIRIIGLISLLASIVGRLVFFLNRKKVA